MPRNNLLMPGQVPECEWDNGVPKGGVPVSVRPGDVTQERFLHHVEEKEPHDSISVVIAYKFRFREDTFEVCLRYRDEIYSL